ncbi:MAG: hypothetical protein ACTHM1_11080 [Solirubrobacteraceae bacterium]
MGTDTDVQNVGEGFNPTTCEEKLKKSKETEPVCPSAHCASFQETELYHADCANSNMYAPVQTMGCYNKVTGAWEFASPSEITKICSKLIMENPSWEFANCYCCCACFADNTMIGLPDGESQILEIEVGENVLAGSPSGTAISWEPAIVTFSNGTGGESLEPAMVYLEYGEKRKMVCSTDQPLMLADGLLTTASRLKVGDQLMGVDGEPQDVLLATIGNYKGGVHHIATGKWTGSIDKHLIQANGIVAGDFALQLHFAEVPSDQKVSGYGAMPEIGTGEYAEENSHTEASGELSLYASPAAEPEVDNEVFAVYGPQADLPLGAQSFITAEQAQDIVENGVQEPITERSGYSLAQKAIELVSGFHRDFVYYVDWGRSEPNVYAFEQYGQKVVLVCGGLARMEGVGFTGLTMAVAQAVARFIGGDPKDGAGYSCTGQADLYAFGVISQQVWFGAPWMKQTMEAIEQLTKLFKWISPENAEGNPRNVCGEPSIECREETWMIALAGGALPVCAGGEAIAPITVEQAKAVSDTEVQVVFSQAPVPSQAEDLAKYSLAPAGTIASAKATGEMGGSVVALQVKEALEPGKYTLTCSKIESVYGGKLEPDPTKVEFEVEGEGKEGA